MFVYLIEYSNKDEFNINRKEIRNFKWVSVKGIDRINSFANVKAIIKRVAEILGW